MFFNETALLNYTVLSLQTKFFKQQTGNSFIAKVKKVPFSKKRGALLKFSTRWGKGKEAARTIPLPWLRYPCSGPIGWMRLSHLLENGFHSYHKDLITRESPRMSDCQTK